MTVVEIAAGKLQGRRDGDVEAFLSVPYAAPPVGPLRFRAPTPLEPWAGVRDADTRGNIAPQDPMRLGSLLGASDLPQDEDCLTLNVWRPAGAGSGSGRPVMVFFHGGGFYAGSAGHPCYDGSVLAERGDLIVVSVQYRLGVLGLLWHPCLESQEQEYQGNWAFQDQVAALRWVAENIAGFGGDPGNVTIFGESAGGAAVALHCISPVSRRYFRRAVVQSSSPLPTTREAHLGAADALFAELGLPADADALRSADVETLLKGQPRWMEVLSAGRTAPRPFVDGALLPLWPTQAVEAGALKGLEILMHYNRDEASAFAMNMPAEAVPQDDAALATVLQKSGLPASLIPAYREARQARGQASDALALFLAIQTDKLIRAPALAFQARHVAAGGRGWTCAVTWESPVIADTLAGRPIGATHTVELPLLFGTWRSTPMLQALIGPDDRAASAAKALQDIWIAFARSGDPATAATGDWPEFREPARATLTLGAETALADDPWGEERSAMTQALLAAGEPL